jgi:hypothetical protein
MSAQIIGGRISYSYAVQNCFRSLRERSLCRLQIIVVDFVLARLDVNDDKLAFVSRLNVGANLPLVDFFAASFDLLR